MRAYLGLFLMQERYFGHMGLRATIVLGDG